MTSLSDIRSQIKSDLVIVGTDYDTQIDNAIRSALRALRKRKFWFLEVTDDLTLAASASTLTLPDNFGTAGTFDIINGSERLVNKRGFDFLDYNKLRNLFYRVYPLPTAQPEACAVSNGTLYFSTIADKAYTVPAVYYQQDATLPTSDANTSVWFDDGYDAVRSLANMIFKRDSQHYTRTEEDGDMYNRYMLMLNRQHERYEGSR